ncbi:hypothetical protein GQ43DRAFT_176008 [Delitschia confertaspora ATCC 74209]|uniref:Uncharacterized protein n=1 Tax=Delitschia confertaspora ATCC 74209 TaxID=1513339 RepID=A0A9P4JF27_9PLEO|nr:hypothetical protein GQ43DRAFT_176008 [Delitschia confertaspora ATCC 74209]
MRLKLTYPEDMPTRRKGNKEIRTHLVFLREQLWQRLIKYKVKDSWAVMKNHIPIRIETNIGADCSQPHERFAIKTLDRERFQDAVKAALQDLQALEQDASHQEINRRLQSIQRILSKALPIYYQKAKPGKPARSRWNKECEELLYQHCRAREGIVLTTKQMRMKPGTEVQSGDAEGEQIGMAVVY